MIIFRHSKPSISVDPSPRAASERGGPRRGPDEELDDDERLAATVGVQGAEVGVDVGEQHGGII